MAQVLESLALTWDTQMVLLLLLPALGVAQSRLQAAGGQWMEELLLSLPPPRTSPAFDGGHFIINEGDIMLQSLPLGARSLVL